MNARIEIPIAGELASPEPGMAVPIDVFFEWLDEQDGIHEYDRGVIGMMVRVTRNHSVLVSRFVHLLSTALDPESYEIHPEAFAVRTNQSIRFPDVLVQRTTADGEALEATDPLIIIEIASKSSAYLDAVVKRDEYLALPSLQAYVVASQVRPHMAVWQKTDGQFEEAPETVEGRANALHLRALNVTLRLHELYRGIS